MPITCVGKKETKMQQLLQEEYPIRSAESMIALIREVGIIPFFKNPVRWWSIQELTHPDWWFSTSDELGPWDWKVDAVREGIVYGKYFARRAAFATAPMYGHLMNWRRSLPQYLVAEGVRGAASPTQPTTIDQRLQFNIAPILLSAIRSAGALDSAEIREVLEREVPPELRRKVGGHMEKYLLPRITKQSVDFLLGFLEMGTWVVVGDIARVYRGPNCEYKGWQRNTLTTPDALLGLAGSFANMPACPAVVSADAHAQTTSQAVRLCDVPSWAKFLEDDSPSLPSCTPQESRDFLLEHLCALFPDSRKALEKMI